MDFHPLFATDWVMLCPVLFLSLSTLVLLTFGVLGSTLPEYPLLARTCTWGAIGCLASSCILVLHSPIQHGVLLSNSFIQDDCTQYLQSLLLVSSCGAALLSLAYIQQEKMNSFEYVILMLVSTAAMLLLVSSYDLLSVYMSLELQSLCLYVLAASKRNSAFATEAGLKYFILGAFASGMYLFGAAMIYGFSGTTHFGELGTLVTGGGVPGGILVGLVCILAAFLFKLTAAPFHMWAPDVYEGAPTSVTAFFALVPKIAMFGVLFRVVGVTFFDLLEAWQPILLLSGFLSLLIGAFGALAQKKLKRMLAFSSVGHVGYLLIGLSCGTVEGFQASFLYLSLYIVMILTMFAVVLSLWHSAGRVTYLSDLSCLAHTNPVLAATCALALFSMAGIPPLAGFFSKFYLFLQV